MCCLTTHNKLKADIRKLERQMARLQRVRGMGPVDGSKTVDRVEGYRGTGQPGDADPRAAGRAVAGRLEEDGG
jgi:hypothetical protein